MSKWGPVRSVILRDLYWDQHCSTSLSVTGREGLRQVCCDTDLCGAGDTLEGRDAILSGLDRHERWDCGNLRKFRKVKHKVLHLGQGNAKHKYRLGSEWIESSPKERIWVLMVNMTWQCPLAAQKAICVLGCIKSCVANRLREMTLLLCSALMKPHLECCIQLWSPQPKKEIHLLGSVQRRP
ncbi:hypothetical protein DUI87_05739 [Hirundo rustica rustica]|uniref:Uncharacterized protein n=1 Tax=Hirundo rustica rustica TaxID=333673 RepID=A0A3M0KV33_HIRRU|nr:hypothetical protein DUI87_05739 [Hirundo rustica rustica]